MLSSERESFKQAVYDLVRAIPYGRATSYGAIAKAAGYPRLSRMVGVMLSQCGMSGDLPAYRVVNSQGVLSGRNAFGVSGEMQCLLEGEGIEVQGHKIKHWNVVFWDPLKELKL